MLATFIACNFLRRESFRSYYIFFKTLKPHSQENTQNIENRILPKVAKNYFPVNPFYFPKKQQALCYRVHFCTRLHTVSYLIWDFTRPTFSCRQKVYLKH
jgi:hypothetical protein